MVGAFVTPSNSGEEESGWIHRLECGQIVSESEWQQFSETQQEEAPSAGQQPSSSSSNVVIRRWSGMVQDMLEPQYVGRMGASDDDLGPLTERIPLVLTRSIFIDAPPSTTPKRVRYNNPVDVEAYFYYSQYPAPPPEETRNKLRLNEMVEIVAVAALPSDNDDDENAVMSTEARTIRDMFPYLQDEDEDGKQTRNLPRWHVVWFSSLSFLTQNAQRLATATIPQQPSFSLPFDILSTWLHSHAQRRQDGNPIITPDDRCLGCASLEWIVSNPDDVSTIVEFLQPACPIVRVVVLSDTTDNDDLVPEKHATGRLQATPLQLPPGSIVVVDATSSARSSSQDQIPLLSRMCRDHRLDYRFAGGVTLAMEADYRIVVLSSVETQGQIPCTLTMKTNTTAMLKDWLWQPCSVVGNIHLPATLLDDAVLPTSATALDRCLLLARLQAARRDSEAVEPCDWKAAVELDEAVRDEMEA